MLAVLAVGSVYGQSGKGLVINEIYIGSAAPVGAASNDEFIEIYNPQTVTLYLDANMIVRFGTGGKVVGAALTQVAEAWRFPGRPGGKTLPVAPGAFVVIAGTAKAYSGGLDLSAAQFETYTATSGKDLDNPNSINLHKLSSGPANLTDFQLSPTTDAVVLTNGTDSVISDGITIASVIDGVNYNVAWVAGTLPASIDAGYTGGPNLKYGYALERNKVGVTTLNSSNDFGLQFPTPGSQHGTTPPPPPPAVVKVTDLMPLDLNRYVAYDEYDTATSGAVPSRTTASYTVFGSNMTYNGINSVAWVSDSSQITTPGSGAVADLHYLPTSAGDIQVYADQSLLNAAIPTGLGLTLTLPNKFVDYLKMSGGVNVSYPVAVINGSATQSGVAITVKITSTGKYRGIEKSISVPAGRFDTTYRFDISNLVEISAYGGLVTGNFTMVQSLWLAKANGGGKGIGIIKSNTPIAGTTIVTQKVSGGGTEKEMTSAGIRAARSVASLTGPASRVNFYPDPAPDAINVTLPRPGRSIMLYSATGRLARSYTVDGGRTDALLGVSDLPNGVYHARIQFADGTQSSANVVVQH